jgi:hypothetical protein
VTNYTQCNVEKMKGLEREEDDEGEEAGETAESMMRRVSRGLRLPRFSPPPPFRASSAASSLVHLPSHRPGDKVYSLPGDWLV